MTDPTWSGLGDKNAWSGQETPYKIHWTPEGFGSADAILSIQPHPAPYFPARVVAQGGDGRPIRQGWARAEWHFARVDNTTMNQIFSVQSNADALTNSQVYIQTRIDQLELITDIENGWQHLVHAYRAFACYIEELTYDGPKPGYFFDDVVIKFNHLETA